MSSEKNDVWLVYYTKTSVELVGVFDDEQKALDVCKDKFYVIGPFEVNKDYTDINEWVGAYRPYGGPVYPDRCECDSECECK